MSKACTCPACGAGMIIRDNDRVIKCAICRAWIAAQAVKDMEELKERKAA